MGINILIALVISVIPPLHVLVMCIYEKKDIFLEALEEPERRVEVSIGHAMHLLSFSSQTTTESPLTENIRLYIDTRGWLPSALFPLCLAH
ncbi:hypothetical protein EDD21DRAFT_392136 [Dissophora ornata]|nr:hypothetical protein EDD21DRAFT_392136 [Dissophora ornata]